MLDYLKSSRLSPSPENPVQTDDGAVAAGSTEITAETTAEELSEEESFRDLLPKLMQRIMKRRKVVPLDIYGKRDRCGPDT